MIYHCQNYKPYPLLTLPFAQPDLRHKLVRAPSVLDERHELQEAHLDATG